MNTKKTIDIAAVIGDDIRTRGRIHELMKYIVPENRYTLDFSDVRFISRSFADELVSFIEKSPVNIECTNMPTEIGMLLEIVRKNRNTPRNPEKKVDVLQLTSIKQMSEFFEAI